MGVAWLIDGATGGVEGLLDQWPFGLYGAMAGYGVRSFFKWWAERAHKRAEEIHMGPESKRASWMIYLFVCLPAYGLGIYCFYVRLVAS